jgi:DNA-binding response OmpR family regulator
MGQPTHDRRRVPDDLPPAAGQLGPRAAAEPRTTDRLAMHRILLVEDSPDLAFGLQRNLEMDGHAVSVATKASQAMALATAERPDLIVLDLGLPDRDGYSVLDELRTRGVQVPVLILSARNLEADKLQGFRLGADDYVTKPFSIMELLARISALLRRAPREPAPLASGAAAAPTALSDEELHERFGLTARQVAVARLLGEGFSNAEIAQQLSVSYFTARNHTEQVLAKLNVPSRAAVGAVLFGRG